jgi:hypothetical protein
VPPPDAGQAQAPLAAPVRGEVVAQLRPAHRSPIWIGPSRCQTIAAGTSSSPHTRCKPSGGPRQWLTPYGAEFVELPELKLAYIFDIGGPHTYRTIYMDGRSHPRNLTPSYYGHSIGWWEGDTLVVDTIGFNEGFWIDRGQLPHTEQLHLLEKYTRTSVGAMRYEVTVDDPGAYTKPFTGTSNLRWEDGTELFEYVCQQANQAYTLMVGEGTSSRPYHSHRSVAGIDSIRLIVPPRSTTYSSPSSSSPNEAMFIAVYMRTACMSPFVTKISPEQKSP